MARLATHLPDAAVGQPPYRLVWSNALPADYVLSARATDNDGLVSTSLEARVSIRLPEAQAIWLQTDATTLGDWVGTYGFDGYHLMTHVAQYPPYAMMSGSGQVDLAWEAPSEDPRALLDDNAIGRLAAAWVSGTNLVFDLTLVDGKSHQLALYCLDWESPDARGQRVDIYDAESRALLDSRSLSNFSGGQYWVWTLRGHVELNVVPAESQTAVVSGLFFDQVSPLAMWKAAWFSAGQRSDPAVSGDSADPDLDGIRNLWEYALGFDPLEPTTAGLPVARIAEDHFYFSYTINLEATDVAVGLEVSSDLVRWQPAQENLEEVESSQTATTRTVTLRSRAPVSGMPQAFVRLRVEKR